MAHPPTDPSAPALVLSAVAEELEPCRGRLRERGVRCGFAALGVGAVQMGVALGDPALRRPWSSVWLVGTAGVYPGSPHEPGAVILVDRFLWVVPEALRGAAYLPPPVPQEARPAPAPVPAEIPRAVCATVPAITTDPTLARTIREHTHADVEHLEAFAAALWAERSGVRFGALLAITNRVGPTAHREWLEQRVRAEAAAADTLAHLLSLPPGEDGREVR